MAALATRHILALIVIALLTQIPGPAVAEINGPAKVIDGDTIVIRGAKIRLHGIDAPESAQVCQADGKSYRFGTSATLALARRIGGRSVSCDERDRDRYGRIVAVCHAGGEDLNGWLVSEGLAIAYRHYSTDDIGQEQAAREAGRGLWRGELVEPWQWRKGNEWPARRQWMQRLELASSRETSAARANGSTTCQTDGPMRRPRLMKAKASGGSAPSRKRKAPVGGGRASDFVPYLNSYQYNHEYAKISKYDGCMCIYGERRGFQPAVRVR